MGPSLFNGPGLVFFVGCSRSSDTLSNELAKEHSLTFKKLTPVLLTHDVDACVNFWSEFGFQNTISVPLDDSKTGFAAVHQDGIELMYQDYAFGNRRLQDEYRSVLYLEVSSIGRDSGCRIAI